MPSPLGHALGAFAAGWIVAGPSERRPEVLAPGKHRSWLRRVPPRALAFGAVGMAADLDLLVGRHSQFTHSVGMTLLVGAVVFAWLHFGARRGVRGTRLRPNLTRGARQAHWVVPLAVAAAYGSHVLLDWLAQDATPPWGITALWPFSASYYLSHLDVFSGISRQPWRPGAAWHDVLAIAREVMLLGPLALGAWWLRRNPSRQILPTSARRVSQEVRRDGRLPADGESR